MRSIPLITALIAWMPIVAHSQSDESTRSASYTPFLSQPLNSDQQDDSLLSSAAPLEENAAPGQLPIDREMYVLEAYVKILGRIIEDPSTVQATVMGKPLSQNQQHQILNLINQIKLEDEQYSLMRVNEMCLEWHRNRESVSAEVRAENALILGKELESRYWRENRHRMNLRDRFLEILAPVDTNTLEASIAEFGSRSSAGLHSWSDLVRRFGREVEQFELMCGG